MRLDWKGALGFVLSGALLWWTLHDEPLGAVWAAVRGSDWRLWAAATASATLMFPMRAWRWRVILDPVAPRTPFGPLWRATAVGMMANNVLPARAGELARAYALTREVPRVPLAASLASLAVDRVFDAVVLLLLLFAAPLDPAFPRGGRILGQSVPDIARGGMIAVVVLLVGLYGIVAFPGRAERTLAAVVRALAPRRRAARLEALASTSVRAFAEGLGVLRHPGRFAVVFAWTLAHWLLAGVSIWIGFQAMRVDAPFSAAIFLSSVASVASAVPSSPGFFGVFEGVSKVALQLYGVPPTLAVSWALGYHVLTFIPITVAGGVYAVRLGFGVRELSGPDAPPDATSDVTPDDRAGGDDDALAVGRA